MGYGRAQVRPLMVMLMVSWGPYPSGWYAALLRPVLQNGVQLQPASPEVQREVAFQQTCASEG